MAFKINRKSLLSSQSRVQVPWIKITIVGETAKYTFGLFSSETAGQYKDEYGTYLKEVYKVQYPKYVQSLNIIKINGQVNQYTLKLVYPITASDDPNMFEKILSSASKTRKIIFSYGDASQPNYSYKDEEAVITGVRETFNLEGSAITYDISAVSGAALNTASCMSFSERKAKPSDVIKHLLTANIGNIGSVFSGITAKNMNELIKGNDKKVTILAKQNISVLDYLSYLVSCMYPEDCSDESLPTSIYILTMHDDPQQELVDGSLISGPYFEVEQVSYQAERSDAYEIDIGYDTRNIVTQFSIENNENYSIFYDYQNQINDNKYVRRINSKGQWEDVYAPSVLSKTNMYKPTAADKTWWTKVTQFPINTTITVLGLLRPAQLLTYVRLNIIFPGGVGIDNTRMHVASGLYIITKQSDTFDSNGYKTVLNMTKVSGALTK